MQNLTYFEFILAQLCLILTAGCIIFRAMLMTSRKRVAWLQQAFDEKIAQINAEIEQRKNALMLNLTEEIKHSEKRYALGSDSVPLNELDVETYEYSLAIPMRLAYLKVEKRAAEKRDTQEYWEFMDQSLEEVLMLIGKDYGLDASSESIDHKDSKELVDQLKDEIEMLRAQEEELLEDLIRLEDET